VSPEKLSLITILEIMHLQGSGGVAEGMKTARALVTIGKAIELEHKAQICKKNNIQLPTNTHRSSETNFFTNSGYQDLHARRVTARKYMEDSEDWAAAWTQVLRVKVGSFLVDALMDVATIMRSTVIKATGEVL
jgi:DNA-directed RNA polymerase, mitochondrial